MDILIIATPLAVLEIYLERFKSGWNGEFYSPFCGKKLYFKWIMKSMERAYISVYHLIMFGVILPTIYLVEYLILAHIAGYGGWVISFYGIAMVPILYLIAVGIGVATLEDLLWAMLNWHYPNTLKRFFNAELLWHTEWVNITPTKKVPKFYTAAGKFFICLDRSNFHLKMWLAMTVLRST